MLEEMLAWFSPGHREAVAKVITHLLERIETLEAQVAAKPAPVVKPAPVAGGGAKDKVTVTETVSISKS